MKTLTLLFISAFALAAQTTINIPTLTISAEATAALNAVLAKTFVDGSQAITLTAPVSATDTTINVVSTAGVAATSAIAISGDAMKITAKTAQAFTVARGLYGTTPAAHLITEQANELKYPTIIRAFAQAIADFVGLQMVQAGSTTVVAQDAIIKAANAAKVAAQTAAVQ